MVSGHGLSLRTAITSPIFTARGLGIAAADRHRISRAGQAAGGIAAGLNTAPPKGIIHRIFPITIFVQCFVAGVKVTVSSFWRLSSKDHPEGDHRKSIDDPPRGDQRQGLPVSESGS